VIRIGRGLNKASPFLPRRDYLVYNEERRCKLLIDKDLIVHVEALPKGFRAIADILGEKETLSTEDLECVKAYSELFTKVIGEVLVTQELRIRLQVESP
jgi:hypothetical protein